MDINQLEVLVAIAREKSFSRAAEVLGRTQPAVSQAIRRLENEIGEKLFDRSSKDGTLTYAGEVLLEYAKQMLNLRLAARGAIRELRDVNHGKVTISANEHTVFFLLPVIEKFRTQYPNIRVDVRRGVASRIPKEITAREVELGVISFKPAEDSINSIEVGEDELVLITVPNHRFASRDSISVKELADEPIVAHNAPSPYRRRVIETFEEYGSRLNMAIELPSLEAIKLMVETGAGVALVPRLTARYEIAAGRLAGVPVREMKLHRKLHIIYRNRSELSHAATAFLETANEMARSYSG